MARCTGVPLMLGVNNKACRKSYEVVADMEEVMRRHVDMFRAATWKYEQYSMVWMLTLALLLLDHWHAVLSIFRKSDAPLKAPDYSCAQSLAPLLS